MAEGYGIRPDGYRLPEGTRVHLSVESPDAQPLPSTARIHTPRLANAEDVADFAMEVRETGDAGL